ANLILSGTVDEWIASAVAVCVALATRSLPLTMGAGIVVVYLLRHHL
ncbi:MAG: AzlD domain-containing protein, partial [Granulosicoccus sp.]|nr:AzlD domain-containing protein [Granulosicoccus sp.]